MRDFAYSQVEVLLRQLNQQRKNTVQNTNFNVYKQLFEKERRQWLEERDKQASVLG